MTIGRKQHRNTKQNQRARYTTGETRYMLFRSAHWVVALSAWLMFFATISNEAPARENGANKPNIVVILADDLGYGDVSCLSEDSTLATPNLDRFAGQGTVFTDAHSPSAVCTPTRYGLITGRYCWRTRLTRGVLGGYSAPLIDEKRETLASFLKKQGYRTACVGKWHLGMDLPMLDDPGDRSKWDGDPGVDFSGIIKNGPTERGFDSYFGVTASLDMPPYVFVEDNGFAKEPTIQQKALRFPDFIRKGPRSDDFEIDKVLDQLADRACTVIAESAQEETPLFLYVPLTAPHKPATPSAEFLNQSGLGPYGDFVMQVDAAIGRILTAINEAGIEDDTLVMITSDNGSYMFRLDPEKDPVDHVEQSSVQGFYPNHHRSNGIFRGTKADIWEAGHHVPFLVRWPGHIEAGSKRTQTICLTDIFATCAEVSGAELKQGVAEDSFSLVPLWQDAKESRPIPVIHHSAAGMFAIRHGDWKLIAGNGSGGREKPSGKPFAKPYMLFDMANDREESKDVAKANPEKVEKLSSLLEEIRSSGTSTGR